MNLPSIKFQSNHEELIIAYIVNFIFISIIVIVVYIKIVKKNYKIFFNVVWL